MKKISLSQGKFAIVDDNMFDYLNQWKWSAKKGRYTYYAMRKHNGRKDGRSISMHRVIMEATESQELDHINGNGWDNRVCNLRFCTNSQNQANKRPQKNCVSKYKGVGWVKNRSRWNSRITVKNKTYYLGYYINEKDAAIAYNVAAKEYYGEFARLNKVA